MSKTNVDRIREMSIEELAEFFHNTYSYVRNGNFVLSLCLGDNNDIEIGDNFKEIKEWLESEAEE